ncbi:MAG: DUF502 domain-containing protein [Pseudomonadota bacterium]
MKNIFKKYFLAGLAVLLPLVITLLILKFFIVSVDQLVISLLPKRIQPSMLFGIDIPGFGFIITILLILAIGVFTRLYVGRKFVQLGDRIISKIPIGAGIYNAMKQFMGTFISDKDQQFKSVVVVEYPRKGSWVLGFVTKSPGKHILNVDDREWVTIFIPTTPNPTSGFLIMTPAEETRAVDITTDEAFKFIISGGYIQKKNESASLKQAPAP